MPRATVPARERWRLEDELRARVEAAISELKIAETIEQKRLAVERLSTAAEILTDYVLRGQAPPTDWV